MPITPAPLKAEEAYFELGGDFDDDQWCYARKFGGLVVVHSHGDVWHKDFHTIGSDDGVVPVEFRPETTKRNVNVMHTNYLQRADLSTTGRLQVGYLDWTGSVYNRTLARSPALVYRRED